MRPEGARAQAQLASPSPAYAPHRTPCSPGPCLRGPGDKPGTQILRPEHTLWRPGHGPASLLVQPPHVSGMGNVLGLQDWDCLLLAPLHLCLPSPLPAQPGSLWFPSSLSQCLTFLSLGLRSPCLSPTSILVLSVSLCPLIGITSTLTSLPGSALDLQVETRMILLEHTSDHDPVWLQSLTGPLY